jgi:thiamine pyrophosphokinase
MPRAVIFANGILSDAQTVKSILHSDDLLIAADGGARHALALGLVPAVLIGDLDSILKADRIRLEAADTQIRQYPQDKNETDLELALQFAVNAGVREILIVAALGGRLDQTLGNLSLLTGPEFAALDLRVDDGVEQAWFVRQRTELRGRPGELVSLIPWSGEVHGVTTSGLRWPLQSETLFPDRTRGISNELVGETALVEIKSGLLLLVHRRNPRS